MSGDYAYVADEDDGLLIIDVSNKTKPVLTGSYNTAGSAHGVFVSGDYAYVADYTNGLVIVDVSDKAAPVLAGSYNTVGYAHGVFVSGDYAYVADWVNGLVILRTDVSAPPRGDLNSDGTLTPADAAIALQIATGAARATSATPGRTPM